MNKNIGTIYLQVMFEAMRMRTYEKTRKQRKECDEN